MATLENDSDLAPGLSLQALLRDSKVATLQSLLGPETLEVLRDVGLDWNDRAALASFASSYLDPSEALRDPESRSRIMGMLPIAKARELAGRLGVSGAADAFHDLERAAAAPDALAVLFSFFGVVRDIRAPSVVQPDTRQVIAEYGLFEHQRAAATKVKLALSRAPRIGENQDCDEHCCRPSEAE